MAQPPQPKYRHRMQAAFYDLLEYLEAYSGPLNSPEEVTDFLESFLQQHPLRYMRLKFGKCGGDFVDKGPHTATTFRSWLLSIWNSHSVPLDDKLVTWWLAVLCRHKRAAFKSSYIDQCREARQYVRGADEIQEALKIARNVRRTRQSTEPESTDVSVASYKAELADSVLGRELSGHRK